MSDLCKNSLSIYVHFPFCKRKCTYCDFASYQGMEHLIPAYMNALQDEIKSRSMSLNGKKISTVYFGGGTPTYPDPLFIRKIMGLLHELFDFSMCQEATLEANPGTLTPQSLKIYQSTGFNRLSIGLQSVNDHELKKIGRIHRFEDFTGSFKHAREAGFDNISADLIFGFPWQTFVDWRNSVDTLLNLNPEHISCYDLILEEGTPLYRHIKNGQYTEMSDVLNRQMYDYLLETLKKAGYKHYEISNFAKPGYESKHNMNYWKTGDYIGFGAGAHSYINYVRSCNTDDILEYISKVKEQGGAVVESEAIDFIGRMSEFAMLGFRLTDGIDLKEFKERFEVNFMDYYRERIEGLLKKELIIFSENKICLTRKGLDYANLVFMEFI